MYSIGLQAKVKNDEENVGTSPTSSHGSEDSKPTLEEESQSQDASSVPAVPIPWPSLEPTQEHHVPHLIYQAQAERPRARPKAYTIPKTQQVTRIDPQFIPQIPNFAAYRTPSYTPTDVLPSYIRPLPDRWLAEDIEYLQKKAALRVPNCELRDELLRSYSSLIHPYMPLLDLDEFLESIQSNGAKGPVSLLLFQAVMFAATAFVNVDHLRQAGYESRRHARRAFFQKARLLYDFDYESDRLTLVQALLLMTYWYETPDDQKDTWHWMGVGLSLAQTIGLHRDPTRSKMGRKRQGLWKRVWWSCYMRDRLIALGMRRPLRIKDEDCDVPMLTLEDFNLGQMPPDAIQILGESSPLHDSDFVQQLAVMCIEKAKFHKLGGSKETTMMLVPKKSEFDADEVMACDRELEEWVTRLPESCSRSVALSFSSADDILVVHRGLLKMVYLATSSALHRPQVLPSSPLPALPPELEELSRKKVRDAAREITEVAQQLHSLNLTRYLPTTAVTVLLPAIIIHLLDIKSVDPSIRATSLQRFSSCMKILHQLRDIYASADFATSFLDAAIRKANITPSNPVFDRREGSNTLDQTWYPMGKSSLSLTPPPETVPSFTLRLSEPEGQAPDLAETPPKSDGQGSAYSPDEGTDGPPATLADLMNIAHEAESIKNDFDELINFEAISDLDWSAPGENKENQATDESENNEFSLNAEWMTEPGTLKDSNCEETSHNMVVSQEA
ncbi:MAG: hypothetical protein Q9160_001367 [Pyrenula sp. 1 TL-2023]